MRSFLDKAARAGSLAEDILLILILGMMIILAGGQILLRNVFDIGFIWGDELLRMLVLWIAVAGAVAASRSDKHISIAILDRFLPELLKSLSKIVINIFTASVTGAVAWFSLQFALTSREYGDILLGSVPAWWLQLILPVGFGLISYRYIVMTFKVVIALLTGETAEADSGSGES